MKYPIFLAVIKKNDLYDTSGLFVKSSFCKTSNASSAFSLTTDEIAAAATDPAIRGICASAWPMIAHKDNLTTRVSLPLSLSLTGTEQLINIDSTSNSVVGHAWAQQKVSEGHFQAYKFIEITPGREYLFVASLAINRIGLYSYGGTGNYPMNGEFQFNYQGNTYSVAQVGNPSSSSGLTRSTPSVAATFETPINPRAVVCFTFMETVDLAEGELLPASKLLEMFSGVVGGLSNVR